jgi:hypothetical protein
MIDELEGKVGLGIFFLDQVYLSIATSADLFNDVIIQSRVVHFEEI